MDSFLVDSTSPIVCRLVTSVEVVILESDQKILTQ